MVGGPTKAPFYASRVIELATELINRRGYLVVGTPAWEVEHKVGERLTKLWKVPVEQPLVIIAETDREDWLRQSQLLGEMTGWQMHENPENGRQYFRVVTD